MDAPYVFWLLGILAPASIVIFGSASLLIPIVRETLVSSLFLAGSRPHFSVYLAFFIWSGATLVSLRSFAFFIPRELVSRSVLGTIRFLYTFSCISPFLFGGIAATQASRAASLDQGSPVDIAGLDEAAAAAFLVAVLFSWLSYFILDLPFSDEPFPKHDPDQLKKIIALRQVAVGLVALIFGISLPNLMVNLQAWSVAPLAIFCTAITVWILIIVGFSFLIHFLELLLMRLIQTKLFLWFLRQTKPASGGEQAQQARPDYAQVFLSPHLMSVFPIIFFITVFWTQSYEPRWTKPENSVPLRDIDSHLADWLMERHPNLGEAESIPLVFVSASGGGLRAAVWTASIMSKLSARDRRFLQNLWSVSAVSGSSLGALAYLNGLTSDAGRDHKFRSCNLSGYWQREFLIHHIDKCLGAFFLRDSLSPVIGALFFRDPIPFFGSSDRTQVLFDAWSYNWNSVIGDSSIENSLRNFSFYNFSHAPMMHFNATHVESGSRIILSNIELDAKNYDHHFVNTDFGDLNWPQIRAAGISALFPYVSNAFPIYIDCKEMANSSSLNSSHLAGCEDGGEANQNQLWGHAVDGGYFENLGLRTTINSIEATLEAWERLNIQARPKIIVIQITNDPSFRFRGAKSRHGSFDLPPNSSYSRAFFTPPKTALNSLAAHSDLQRLDMEVMEEAPNTWEFFHIRNCRTNQGGDAPLTWYLGEAYIRDLIGNKVRRCGDSWKEFARAISVLRN